MPVPDEFATIAGETGQQQPRGPIVHVNLARGFRGGERQTELLLRELNRTGLRQRLVARRGEPLLTRVSDIPHLERCAVSGIAGALRACRGSRLVHVHDGRSVQVGALARALFSIPYVITRRVDNPLRSTLFHRWAYSRAAALVGLSEAIARCIRRLDPGLHVQVIPSAWNPEPGNPATVQALRERYRGHFVAGCVGALDNSHKGQLTLISAAAQLPDVLFVLVGSGADEERFRSAAAGLENVVFEGQVSDVAAYLAAFDLFVLPSLHEGLGSILLDAMHHGLPIIASDVGGIPEIVTDGRQGLLVPPGDPEALARAIRTLKEDAAIRHRCREAADEFSPAFSPGLMAERYLHLYRTVLAPADG